MEGLKGKQRPLTDLDLLNFGLLRRNRLFQFLFEFVHIGFRQEFSVETRNVVLLRKIANEDFASIEEIKVTLRVLKRSAHVERKVEIEEAHLFQSL